MDEARVVTRPALRSARARAWSPGAAPPSIATGTKAGAVDADFSNDTTLELWDLGLDNAEQSTELQPVGSIATDSRHVGLSICFT